MRARGLRLTSRTLAGVETPTPSPAVLAQHDQASSDAQARRGATFGYLDKEHFQTLVANSPECVKLVSPAGTLLEMNRAGLRMVEADRLEEVVGRSVYELIAPEHRPAFRSMHERVCQGSQERLEFEIIGLKGTRRWLETTAVPIADPGGEGNLDLGLTRDITQRKLAQAALCESEERYRAVVETQPELVCRFQPDGKILFANRAYASNCGVSQQELSNHNFWDFIPIEDRPLVQALLEGLTPESPEARIENRFQTPQGERWFLWTNRALRFGPDRRLAEAQALGIDITQRKGEQEASRWLAAVVDSSDDAIISKDLDGIIRTWNRGAQEMFGYTAEEVIGRSVRVLMPPERQAEEGRILERIRRGERVEHFETVRQRKDGSLLDISLTISPVKDGNGNILGASKIARNITQRKRAERLQSALFTLVEAVNRADATPAIFEAALEAICRCENAERASILLLDSEGVMRFQAWRGLSEAYRKKVEGHSPWRRDDPDPQPVCIPNLAEAAIEASLAAAIEREGIRALTFIPLTFERRLLGKFMVYYDRPHVFTQEELRAALTIASQVAFAIERRKSAEELERLVNERTFSLREAIAQMEEFSYTVSHDLRSPVRAMKGYAKALYEDYGDRLEAQGRRFIERIIQSGSRMERLIHDVLTYGRISRIEMELQPVSLHRLVSEVMKQYPELDRSRADFVIQEKLPWVLAHEASLGQSIANLLTNAVKFARPGTRPKVRIHAARQNASVILRVQDNGIGVRPEHQSRLFGLFERIHPEQNHEGTGIGLAIVRRAVERMGGTVGVDSDGENGSTFWIQLRAAEDLKEGRT